MPLEFTNNGLIIDTYQQAFDSIAEQYRGIYGQDIDLATNTPDGQRVGIEAKFRHDVQVLFLQLYSSLDPNLAEGEALNRIIKLIGINRRPATRSTWDIDVTTDRLLTLQAGYTIQDDIGQNWIITSDVALPIGTTTVTFRAESFGAVTGLSGSSLSQATIVLGVTGLNATSDATAGIEEETDAELRIRRLKSLQNASYSTTGSLFAKLANAPGVTDLAVYENDTDATDANGIGPHTLWCVVEGGGADDIAEIIAKNKTGGTPLKGDTVSEYVETVIRPDGSTFMIVHRMRFDRPSVTPIYVTVTATRKDPAIAIDTALIAQEIAKAEFNIGQNAIASQLYSFGYNAGNGYVLTDMLISDDDVTYTDERLISALDGKFTLDAADVTVTEVIS